MFDRTVYEAKLRTQWLGSDFHYKEQAESTSSILKSIPSGQLKHGTVLLADDQLRGRGRYDRRWVSEPRKNLTFTVAFKPRVSRALPLLMLGVAWGVVQALNSLYGDKVRLKWPNDLMISGRKTGGILTEIVFNGPALDRMLVGIGLNVNQVHFSDDLKNATSLALETGKPVEREALLCVILDHIEQAYLRWQNDDKSLIHDINRTIQGFGQWVEISVNGHLEGEKVKFLGINELGHLITLTREIEVKTYTHEQIRIQTDH